jgi:hypothetical protein
MSRRYAMDYQIVVCDEPAELETRLRNLAGAGTPIAMVIGGVGGWIGTGSSQGKVDH